jgi:hypothetical protein
MSCGCTPNNDKCIRDSCKNCCYCGKLLRPDPMVVGALRHVDPPEAPMCPRSDKGHEPLEFPEPKHEDNAMFVFGYGQPPCKVVVGELIEVRLCKLCGLVYWDTIKKGDKS